MPVGDNVLRTNATIGKSFSRQASVVAAPRGPERKATVDAVDPTHAQRDLDL